MEHHDGRRTYPATVEQGRVCRPANAATRDPSQLASALDRWLGDIKRLAGEAHAEAQGGASAKGGNGGAPAREPFRAQGRRFESSAPNAASGAPSAQGRSF